MEIQFIHHRIGDADVMLISSLDSSLQLARKVDFYTYSIELETKMLNR